MSKLSRRTKLAATPAHEDIRPFEGLERLQPHAAGADIGFLPPRGRLDCLADPALPPRASHPAPQPAHLAHAESLAPDEPATLPGPQ